MRGYFLAFRYPPSNALHLQQAANLYQRSSATEKKRNDEANNFELDCLCSIVTVIGNSEETIMIHTQYLLNLALLASKIRPLEASSQPFARVARDAG
jgi:hypothetical protein